MRIKISIMTVLALGVVIATAMAADVTGTWVWKGQGQGQRTPSLELNLKADGNDLTGTVAFTTGEPVPVSLLIQNGQSLKYVSDQLGHSSIKMTADVYGHLVPGANQKAMNSLPSINVPKDAKTIVEA